MSALEPKLDVPEGQSERAVIATSGHSLVPWAPIIRPSDGWKGDTVPLAVARWYDFHEVGCHLGNVGLIANARGPDLVRPLGWLETIGRWSMLDVFMVVLTIVAVEVSIISNVTTHAGLYVFTAAVVLSMAGVRRLVVLARGASSDPDNPSPV